jgi:hypothetical protein
MFRRHMRKFLYSKWFYGLLAAVCILDLVADLGEHLWGWTDLNILAIALDLIAVSLTVWIFADLHRRRPRDGDRTGG